MNPLESAALFVGALIAIVLISVAFDERSRRAAAKDGYQLGYTQGRKDADNWWLGVESEADKARVEIWRKEAQR